MVCVALWIVFRHKTHFTLVDTFLPLTIVGWAGFVCPTSTATNSLSPPCHTHWIYLLVSLHIRIWMESDRSIIGGKQICKNCCSVGRISDQVECYELYILHILIYDTCFLYALSPLTFCKPLPCGSWTYRVLIKLKKMHHLIGEVESKTALIHCRVFIGWEVL